MARLLELLLGPLLLKPRSLTLPLLAPPLKLGPAGGPQEPSWTRRARKVSKNSVARSSVFTLGKWVLLYYNNCNVKVVIFSWTPLPSSYHRSLPDNPRARAAAMIAPPHWARTWQHAFLEKCWARPWQHISGNDDCFVNKGRKQF